MCEVDFDLPPLHSWEDADKIVEKKGRMKQWRYGQLCR